jgi:2-oxo-3-hexenedioate decarboxylase
VLSDDLIAAHDSAREVPPFSERYPGISSEDAYRAARALNAHRLALGWQPVGRKIGFTNRTLWERYGVHEPMWGTVYDRTLLSAHNEFCTVPLAGLVQPRIEPEIAFRLSRAPRSSDPAHLLDCIEWMAHAVEIVQCHHADWKVTLADCCADNGLHGRLVLGTPIRVDQVPGLADKLPQAEARLFKGDTLTDRGVAANVLGSPLLSLGYLVELLQKQRQAEPLRAGEIVSTGVITDAHPVRAGETWSTRIEGLPLAGLTIEFL